MNIKYLLCNTIQLMRILPFLIQSISSSEQTSSHSSTDLRLRSSGATQAEQASSTEQLSYSREE